MLFRAHPLGRGYNLTERTGPDCRTKVLFIFPVHLFEPQLMIFLLLSNSTLEGKIVFFIIFGDLRVVGVVGVGVIFLFVFV